MACSSCQKEWYFTGPDGQEVVEVSHFKALQARRRLGVPSAPVNSRPKPKA